MHRRLAAPLLLPITVVLLAGCGGGQHSAGSALSCSTYNTVNTNPDQYIKNTNAVSDLLLAHGVNPRGNHHYDSAAGSYMMNVTVASAEVTSYCTSNPNSTVDQGITWSNFKSSSDGGTRRLWSHRPE